MLLLALSVCAFAQDATIVGTVTDPSGSVVPNANVTATNTETGIVRSVKSGDGGQYLMPTLPIGHYDVKVDATGFKSESRTGLVLNVNDRTRIDFALQVGSTSESLTVEANAVKVQTETGDMSTVITGQQVTQLATNGRSVLSLYALSTGASSIQGDFGAIAPVSGDNNVAFNGGRPGHNLMILDGGENLDRGGTGLTVMPSIDAIAEFRLQTSSYSADYGLTGSGTVTTAIKSGTKTFHGAAWEFNRNDAMQARDFTHPKGSPQAELRLNNFGFNLGGPLPMWKDTHPTFFFYNMEWRRLIQGAQLNTTVPLTSTYGGDFTTAGLSLANLHAPFSCQLSPAEQTTFTNAGQALSGCTAGAPDTTQEVAFNAQALPFVTPNATSLLNAGIFPAPNSGTQFLGGTAVPTNVREELGRIDHQFSPKFSIFGHFIAEQVAVGYATTQWSGDNVPTVGDTMGNPSYSAVVHTTHIISPTLLNEVAFNYNGNRIAITPTGTFAAPSDFAFNRFFSNENALNRIPSINLTGNANYTSNWTPWNNKADGYQLRDDISWTKGAHQFKFGASWALYKKIQDIFVNTQGNFTFNGKYTGNSFADFLLGYAQGYNEAALKDNGNYHNVSWASYIQDNWRVNNRLTLNLGLRWDGVPHTYESNNRLSNFDPAAYDPAAAAVFLSNGSIDPNSPGLGASPNPLLAGIPFYVNGMVIDGKGAPKGLVDNHWALFQPRLGFAYDLTGQGKTVIRAGFSSTYDRIQGNDVYDMGGNVPFSSSPSFNDVFLSDPKTRIIDGQTITGIPIVASDITGLDRSAYKPPITYQYNVGIQHSLGSKLVVSANYVGAQMRDMSFRQEVNLPDASLLPALQADSSNLNNERPFVGYRGIRLSRDLAEGHYNSLQTELRGQVSKDLNLQFGYTLAKAEDPWTSNGDGGDLQNVTNPYAGWQYDEGPSNTDRRHVAFVNFVYDVPFLRNSSNKMAKYTLGGWQISGIISMQSGTPLNIALGGQNVASVIPNSGNRPDLVGPIKYTKTFVSTGFQWFDPTSFAAPAAGTFGDLAHNALRGPGRDNWNLSLFKTFNFTERVRFELRAETFNTWNHLQYKGGDVSQGGISNNTQNSNFGTITGAFDPRTLQLGGKFIF